MVRTAFDGLDALEKLRAGLPDLIISDLNMPRMSGIELLEVVRKRFPQIPVIVISAVAANEMPEEVAADAYYHKNGFGFQQLLQTISDLTTKSPLRTAPRQLTTNQSRQDGMATGTTPWSVPTACGRPRFLVAPDSLAASTSRPASIVVASSICGSMMELLRRAGPDDFHRLHFMNKFRTLGFIEYNGGLEVNSSLLSVVLHD